MACILGIETSCDDTAAAILVDGRIRASIVSSQDAVHGPFGGVVPELASREHLRNLLPVLEAALDRAGVVPADIDAVGVTRGPGLVGSLLVGLSAAKGMAMALGVPLIAVNHLEGHVLSILLDHAVAFPFVALLASGGHTSLYLARDLGRYACLGRTRDDAAGEAFDKAAKLLGLGYPGGRMIDESAREGRRDAIRFPRARLGSEGYDFSFSGLKTAVVQHVRGADAVHVPDVAASVQEAVVDVLVENAVTAAVAAAVPRVVVVGGVAANSRLRTRLAAEGEIHGIDVIAPPLRLCTDNAAMIAYVAEQRLAHGALDDLDVEAEAHLPLEPGWRD